MAIMFGLQFMVKRAFSFLIAFGKMKTLQLTLIFGTTPSFFYIL